MKKIMSLLLVLVLAFSMVACGSTNTPETTSSTELVAGTTYELVKTVSEG